jgi:uncharacterized protein (TIRG00374 family)
MNWKRAATHVFATLLALFFLWLSFRGVSLAELGEQLRRARWGYLLIFVLATPTHMFVRSWRWRALLDPVRRGLSLRELYSAVAIGFMAMLLPGRVGEVLRPALLSRRTGVPFPPTLATVGVERAVLDLLAVLVSGAIALLLPPSVSGIVAEADPVLMGRMRRIGAVLLAIGIVALIQVYLMGRFRKPIGAWLERLAARRSGRVLPAIIRWVASLLPGFAEMATFGGLLRVALQTALLWTVIGIGMHAGILASGVDIPLAAMLIMLPILTFGFSLPTPGGTGTLHLAMKMGLVKLFGVDEAAALGAGLIVHAFNWLPILVVGSIAVARGGLVRRVVPGEGAPDAAQRVSP